MSKDESVPYKYALDTGSYFYGMRVYTDVLMPNCINCFGMSGNHEKTKERGFYAFCTKSGKLTRFGPYRSHNEAIRALILSKGCDSCEFNKSPFKEGYLPIIDERIREEMATLFGKENQSVEIILTPTHKFMEARIFLDINFVQHFGIKLFQPHTDDGKVACDFQVKCSSQNDFSNKIQGLAGIIDRMNVDDLKAKIINIKDVKDPPRSLNLLEQFLKENYSTYPRHIISNLRSVMTLRSKMPPAHASTSEVIQVLNNLGIASYPLDDWEQGFQRILGLCTQSMTELTKLLQTVKPKENL